MRTDARGRKTLRDMHPRGREEKDRKRREIMAEIKEFLPFLIPLIIVQFSLLGYTLYHILTHRSYKRGSRALWLTVTLIGMNFVGPVLYFIFGKEDA